MEKKECQYCGKTLVGHKGRKYCSRECFYKFYYFRESYKSINTERAKRSQKKREFGLTLEQYKELTKKCTFCNWKWGINLHHRDGNKNNNQ